MFKFDCTLMTQQSDQVSPYWVPFAFVGIWLFITGLLAVLSGWPSLTQGFRARDKPSGERFSRQVVRVGVVPENGVTNLIVCDEGLYLRAFPLFRLLRPPLLIPWASIRLVRHRKIFWSDRYELSLANLTTVTVKPRAYQAIQKHLASQEVSGVTGPGHYEE